MKKCMVWIAVLLLLGCTGCQKTADGQPLAVSQNTAAVVSAVQESRTVSQAEESRAAVSEEPVSRPQNISAAEVSDDDKVSEEIQLPVGVSRYGKGKLRFTTSVLSLSVVFPEEFYLLNTDYYPSYGIYLRNREGTATLLTESVVDKTLTYRQMASYLKEQYPEAKVYTTDSKEVVCKLFMTDEDGHELYIQQKIRVQSGGYNAAVLCCRAEDKAAYEKVFNEISFH